MELRWLIRPYDLRAVIKLRWLRCSNWFTDLAEISQQSDKFDGASYLEVIGGRLAHINRAAAEPVLKLGQSYVERLVELRVSEKTAVRLDGLLGLLEARLGTEIFDGHWWWLIVVIVLPPFTPARGLCKAFRFYVPALHHPPEHLQQGPLLVTGGVMDGVMDLRRLAGELGYGLLDLIFDRCRQFNHH